MARKWTMHADAFLVAVVFTIDLASRHAGLSDIRHSSAEGNGRREFVAVLWQFLYENSCGTSSKTVP